MNKGDISVERIVKLLEEKISIVRSGRTDEYADGVIDGLLIAIRTIEN